MRHPFFDMPVPSILGHRGAAGSAPENTLTSFERGLELGAHAIESDVHQTRDGVLVLIHDPDVERISGLARRVDELSLDELKGLDAGASFSPDGGASFPYRGAGLEIPTLDETFARFPGVRFNLEIKQDAPGLIPRVLESVTKHDRAGLTLLAAGDDPVMQALRRAHDAWHQDFAIGACLADILEVIQATLEERPPAPGPMALQIPPDFGGRPLVTRELVAHAHAHEIAVHVWTLNDPREMHEVLDLGVDGIVTDHPERMVDVLAERS